MLGRGRCGRRGRRVGRRRRAGRAQRRRVAGHDPALDSLRIEHLLRHDAKLARRSARPFDAFGSAIGEAPRRECLHEGAAHNLPARNVSARAVDFEPEYLGGQAAHLLGFHRHRLAEHARAVSHPSLVVELDRAVARAPDPSKPRGVEQGRGRPRSHPDSGRSAKRRARRAQQDYRRPAGALRHLMRRAWASFPPADSGRVPALTSSTGLL